MALIPASATNHEASSVSAGMSGTAPSTVSVNDVFVPSPRTLPMRELTSGAFPQRRYTSNPYFNRPWMMWASAMGAAAVLGIARGAMQVFMEAFADGGPIAYTCWTKVAESPLLHHQLATAQFELEITEMYLERIRLMLQQTWAREATVLERVKTRAALGQITAHARTCVNVLFEACGASPTLPSGDIQRFFLQMNGIHQHIGIQPRSSDELYGRLLVGLKPDTDLY
jgi:alkylation response protein AidB-like acyl-CoA dehydrogenase